MTLPAPRPLLVSTYDQGGGAALAALRLHRGLRAIGVDSRMRVRYRRSHEAGVAGPAGAMSRAEAWVRPRLESLPVRRYRSRRASLFTAPWLGDRLERDIEELAPDVVHLHWIAHGFARIETLARIRRPLVWTLHDSWAFTGGCHLPFACVRYRDACGACPALGSDNEHDLSRRVWERKRAAWRDLGVTIVTPSRWLAGCVRASSLLGASRCEVIPNGLDLDRFRPGDRVAARHRLGIPPGRTVLLCGGAGIGRDVHKGLPQLAEALRRLPAVARDGLEVLLFGAGPDNSIPDAGMPIRNLGTLGEPDLAATYAAADLFVAPSLAENLPYTVMEAMACGIPTAAFDVGGVGELIGHERSGWLAPAGDAEHLARGIAWMLEDPSRRQALGACARARAEAEFESGLIARRHADLYRDILTAGSGAPVRVSAGSTP